ncbi:hypothetical protein C8Q76DRAFT_803424 [Earliella scabrosa]|nr:hypothetical protein C8Q76DRAFT_803424 [Earliella scabrosa]
MEHTEGVDFLYQYRRIWQSHDLLQYSFYDRSESPSAHALQITYIDKYWVLRDVSPLRSSRCLRDRRLMRLVDKLKFFDVIVTIRNVAQDRTVGSESSRGEAAGPVPAPQAAHVALTLRRKQNYNALQYSFYDPSKITLSVHALQVAHIDKCCTITSPRSLSTPCSRPCWNPHTPEA